MSSRRRAQRSRVAPTVLPLGAMAAGLGLSLAVMPVLAQQAAPTESAAQALPDVKVKAKADPTPEAKQTLQAVTTTIGKGKQALRDIPQSVTVVTEKLMDDRNLDTLKEALKNTAGITFLAAEGGEEDIRLRGFSLAGTGDIFVDGMRDPAFYERDTFNMDRLEVMRGSASMLFGRGSTGGAVNQVSKQPFLMDQHEVSATVGSHNYVRGTGDFNWKTGENAALRLNVMKTQADNNGMGTSLDKQGVAGALRWGIGTQDEFQVSLYHLDNRNGMNYGLPWILPTATSPAIETRLLPGLSPDAYFGAASDYNHGSANLYTFSHTHRFAPRVELKTQVRTGSYTRDQRASTIRFCRETTTTNATTGVVTVNNAGCTKDLTTLANFSPSTVLTRGSQNKVQEMDVTAFQSDLSASVVGWGGRHDILAGVDAASEQKRVYSLLDAVTKPRTTVGAGGGGAVNEGARRLAEGNNFDSTAWGVYVQDLWQVAETVKLLAGARFDNVHGTYNVLNTATGALSSSSDQRISEWSHRLGALWQPSVYQSYHVSWGTSFNTSGDTYSYAGNVDSARDKAANTPPESSENFEIGGKLDWDSGRYTTRFALFHAVKKNERNTDQESVSGDSYLLSGKRHSTGLEFDVAGRLTPKWEAYVSYTWIPEAKVDEQASATFGNRKGDRPGLIPVHSGSVWTTYQLTETFRLGGGVNFRSKQSPADTSALWYAPGFHTIDLMAEYKINNTFTLKANIANVEDTYYADALYRGHYIPGAGRIAQLELVAKF